ncbi:pyridoxal phosphate-dependent aminotransferase [Streptomyces toyocaensis]|uniref:Pyridoxal phosphate-dependent aminotransferase n=1 Tax=Streptomyces toyocaensis TaxID=55952 RepID=A0A081XYM8_STRTO|nr:DegT/DnrJ/EryC1/StrS aminotransferase family protein [Streptomyces toyocaensis]KES08651.1 pyridoxal phosphate-dependent aminotransferase [Streptomyces toyocaensis]
MTTVIPLVQASLGERELAAVAEVFAAGRSAGRPARELEAELTDRFDAADAVVVSDGAGALRLAMLGLGVEQGDEVIVADYGSPVPAHAVRHAGAVPVLADVRADTGTVDPWAVADLIGPRTVGVIAVDTVGLPADYTELRWLTDRHGLFLVEDAICAAGASYKGRRAGALAPVACLSPPGHQGAVRGEGAALLTRDPVFGATARTRSSAVLGGAVDEGPAGLAAAPECVDVARDHRPSDVAAAILRVQLARTEELLRRRRAVAARYAGLLADEELLSLPHVPQNRCHAWQSYVVTLDPGVDRAAVAAELRARGIGCGHGAWATHLLPAYEAAKHACPVSADLFRHNLALPMHAELTPGQVERVADALRTALRTRRPAPMVRTG